MCISRESTSADDREQSWHGDLPVGDALRLASTWMVDFDRAPMLQYLFPTTTHDGAARIRSQRAFLEALAEREDLWDRKNGSAMAAFKRAGLPYSRAAILEIVRSGRLPPV